MPEPKCHQRTILRALRRETIYKADNQDHGVSNAEREFASDWRRHFGVAPSAKLVAEFSSLRQEIYRGGCKRCVR